MKKQFLFQRARKTSSSECEEFMAGGLRHISQLVEQATSSDGIEKWKGVKKGSDEREDRGLEAAL